MIENFPTGEYKCVVIDPPWPVDHKAVPMNSRYVPSMPYKMMSLEAITALPIANCLARDALVFVWTTQKFLPACFGILVAWGLKYRWTMAWHKRAGTVTGEGVTPFNSPLYNCEFVVVGANGNPKLTSQKQFKTCFAAPTRGHSIKPAEFYSTIARVTEPPRLDIFSRRLIPGFDVWGDEVPTEVLSCSQYPLFEGSHADPAI